MTDDRTLFEFLTLESAQAGLAWITVLRKREGYRRAFLDFDYRRVAAMTEADEDKPPIGRLPSIMPDRPTFRRYFSPSIFAAPRR